MVLCIIKVSYSAFRKAYMCLSVHFFTFRGLFLWFSLKGALNGENVLFSVKPPFFSEKIPLF